jgi:predicted polyphosphate/ATP-dependent NAD kinase
LALDEIKAAEQAKLQELVTAEIQTKDREILELKEQMNRMQYVAELNYKSYDELVEEVYQKAKQQIDMYRKQLGIEVHPGRKLLT